MQPGGEANEQEWMPAVLCFIVGIRRANAAHPQAVTEREVLRWALVGPQRRLPQKSEQYSDRHRHRKLFVQSRRLHKAKVVSGHQQKECPAEYIAV